MDIQLDIKKNNEVDIEFESRVAVVNDGTITKPKLSPGLQTQIDNSVPEAPTNNILYGRKNGKWEEVFVPSEFEDVLSYGIELDNVTGTRTRIGSQSLHKTLPIQNLMRGCLLNDDGTVNKYLNSSDWTNEVRDGSQGQVMVEVPQFFYKYQTSSDGSKTQVRISQYQLSGYSVIPKFYYGAYKAALDRSTSKLSSVFNTTANYRGGGNQADWDSTFRSQIGTCATNTISLTSARNFAQNRGYKWHSNHILYYSAIAWLFYIEYCTTNCRLAVNNDLTIGGYRQGGLGTGVSTVSNWNRWSYYPVVKNGCTDILGNKTGSVSITLDNGDGTTQIVQPNRYRGIEMPFGHIWELVDGLLADTTSTYSRLYYCKNINNVNNIITSDYSYQYDLPITNGYIKTTNNYNLILTAKDLGASSNTFFTGFYYTGASTSAGLKCFIFGGSAANSYEANISTSQTLYAPTYSSAGICSRLIYVN